MTETRPTLAATFAVIAIITGALAWYKADWSLMTRTILALVGVVFGVLFGAWLLDLFIYLVGKGRAAWHYPILKQLEAVRGMSDLQLRVVLNGYIHVQGIPTGEGLVWRYLAPGTTDGLTPDRVRYWADFCTTWSDWPNLPAQHGFNDGTERAELRVFTAIVCGLGIAEPGSGPNPARWTVKRERVYTRLEL